MRSKFIGWLVAAIAIVFIGGSLKNCFPICSCDRYEFIAVPNIVRDSGTKNVGIFGMSPQESDAFILSDIFTVSGRDRYRLLLNYSATGNYRLHNIDTDKRFREIDIIGDGSFKIFDRIPGTKSGRPSTPGILEDRTESVIRNFPIFVGSGLFVHSLQCNDRSQLLTRVSLGIARDLPLLPNEKQRGEICGKEQCGPQNKPTRKTVYWGGLLVPPQFLAGASIVAAFAGFVFLFGRHRKPHIGAILLLGGFFSLTAMVVIATFF